MATPTPFQIARFGHIAVLLRTEMEKRKWNGGDLSQAIGLDRDSTRIYPWLKGTGAPGPNLRPKIAKVLGVEESELMGRNVSAKFDLPPRVAPLAAIATTKTGDVLAFNVASDGMARIRLDVTLPVDEATPLLRMLLDAGFVLGKKVE
jgi:transcriptional regulator with XRE-family HTH domain